MGYIFSVLRGANSGTEEKKQQIEEENQSVPWCYPYDEELWMDHCPKVPGIEQSPIDLPESMDKLEVSFKFNLNYAIDHINFTDMGLPINLINNGNTILMDISRCQTLTIIDSDKVYNLVHFHFHTASEHTIEEHAYPLEMHLVHKLQGASDLLVLGIFFNIEETDGKANDFLASFWDYLPGPGRCEIGEDKQEVNLSTLASAISGSKFYTYNGSLTTPPLTEGVKWIVAREPLHCSKEQILHFQKRSGHKGNFRPTQPLYARDIFRTDIVRDLHKNSKTCWVDS